jgi:DNA polymerase elongation subunit (family B)
MKKSFEFVPVDYDYFDFEGRNFVQMIGRDGEGRKVCVVDSYEANFYLILRDGYEPDAVLGKIESVEAGKGGRVSKVLRTEVLDKHFLGKKVRAVRVWVSNHKDVHEMVSKLGDMEEIDYRREWDISLVTKYIKEKKVEPLRRYQVRCQVSDVRCQGLGLDKLDVADCYFAESIEPVKDGKEFVPRILAYDIETTGREIGEGEILCISVFGSRSSADIPTRFAPGTRTCEQVTLVSPGVGVSEEVKKVITWKNVKDSPDYVEVVEDEAAMLERFCEVVREADADILTGYFSDGFDLPYLKARADKLKVILDLGVNGRNPAFARGRIPSGKIAGTVHVDLYRFVDSVFSQYLQSETLSLNEVAGELVGAKKEDFDFSRLKNMQDEDWRDFFSYNLQDAVVTYDLALKLWPDMREFSRIVKEPVFNVTRDRMATHVENHILHNLDRFDEIAERRPGHSETNERKMKRKFEGAFVFEPVPGFYEDIAMFDFTSMHSSLIVSFNISGQNLRLTKCENCFESPEFELDGETRKVYFDKKPGFFSTLLSEIVDLRKIAKDEWKRGLASPRVADGGGQRAVLGGDDSDESGVGGQMADGESMLKARSNAYKLLANATFGYQGFYGARYYSREAAAATLAYVRQLTHDTMDKISGEGYKVIYGDTDSIVLLSGGRSHDEILKFLAEINKGFPGIIELDLEGFFKRGLFVAKRGSKTGAKKKYALIGEDDKVKIRGFETVRRDWCGLTRKLQDKVLRKILRDGNEKGALKLVRDVVERLKGRNVELDDLAIKTKMKREVGDYVAEGPHVAAAKKMIAMGEKVGVGTFVEYWG